MIRSKSRLAMLLMVLAISPFLLSCSDDDAPTDPGNGGGGGENLQMANSVAAALTPLVTQGYLGAYGGLLKSSRFETTTACAPVDGACESGSLEFCPDANGGTVNFMGCLNQGVTANGSIVIAGNQFAGSAELAVSFNEVGVVGTIGYLLDQKTGCLNENFAVTVSVESDSYDIFGSLQYCLSGIALQEGDFVPSSGSFTIEIPRVDMESIHVTIEFLPEPPGSYTMSFYDAEINQTFFSCTGNVLTGALDCSEGSSD